MQCSDNPPTLNDAHHHNDKGDDEQKVDKTAQGCAGEQTDEPEDNEKDDDGV